MDRPLNADEAALWARVIASVRPIGGRVERPASVAPSAPAKAAVPSRSLGAGPPPSRGNSKAVSAADATLDGSWDRKLSRGIVSPDLAVDLHGHTLDSAYRVLDQGLDHAIRTGARVMLLVTGKPPTCDGSRRGAIRGAVGDWLAASRHAAHIAAVRGAHSRHGGTGALYIILRRPRSPI